MTDRKSDVKTAQPHSEDLADTTSPGVGAKPKPRPDAIGDPKKAAKSPKTTQRTE